MSNNQWQFETQKSGEVKQVEFDPIILGFTKYIPCRYAGKKGQYDKDYFLITGNGKDADGNQRTNMELSLCEDTVSFITNLIGETCDLYINAKCQVLMTVGETLRISGKSKTGRKMVSTNGLKDKLIEGFGNFKRLYVTGKPYANGNAILFIPNGDRDIEI